MSGPVDPTDFIENFLELEDMEFLVLQERKIEDANGVDILARDKEGYTWRFTIVRLDGYGKRDI